MHTNNAETSSPIQRKAVDTSRFEIYQDITVRERNGPLLVSQVVVFGEGRELKLDALASTSAYPLEGLSERKGTGKMLGLNLLGVSLVGDEAKENSEKPDSRINFVFDEGNFHLGNGIKVRICFCVATIIPIECFCALLSLLMPFSFFF